MIGFVVALESEANAFINKIENLSISKLAGKPLYQGTFCGKNVVLIISNIGKVNASLSTQTLIDNFSPKLIINFGTAGGMDDSVKPKEYYIIDKSCQYDFDLSELENVSVGFIQGFNTVYFNSNTINCDLLPRQQLATADRFTDKEIFLDIINNLNCKLRDMEGCAIAQTCTSNNIDLLTIKGVSDVIDSKSSSEQFLENLKAVSDGFPSVIEKILKNLQ